MGQEPLFKDYDDGWRRFQPDIPKAGLIPPEGNIVQIGNPMKIWIYVDTRYHVGHPDHIKAFADTEAAEEWFKENEPEGVAFEYEVIAKAP